MTTLRPTLTTLVRTIESIPLPALLAAAELPTRTAALLPHHRHRNQGSSLVVAVFEEILLTGSGRLRSWPMRSRVSAGGVEHTAAAASGQLKLLDRSFVECLTLCVGRIGVFCSSSHLT